MAFILCTSESIVTESGLNASSIACASSAILEQAYKNASGYIQMATRYDWESNYGAQTSYAKMCLANGCSKIAANDIIKFSMAGYPHLGEAEDLINVNYDAAGRIMEMLKKYKTPEDSK